MGGRLCLVMGSEGDGISRLVRERCDFECKLPQRGRVESLNVAQAATVMCYEWLRRVSLEEAQVSAGAAGEGAGAAGTGGSLATGADAAGTGGSLATDEGAAGAGGSLAADGGVSLGAGASLSSRLTASLAADDFMTDAAADYDIDWDL